MKTATLLVFVIVAFATAEDFYPQAVRDGMIRFFSTTFSISTLDAEKCVNTTGASIEGFMEMEVEVNDGNYHCQRESVRKITCAIVCCAHIQGSMVDGKINVPFVNKLISESGMPETAMSVVVPIFLWCNEKVKLLTDQCDVGCVFLKCLVDNTKNIGM